MQNASMLEANCPRNSDFPETFSRCDTRSISKFLRGHLLAPFHFDVQNPQKAATAANHMQFFTVPNRSAGSHLRPRCFGRLQLQLTILPAKLCMDTGPRRERPLPIEYLNGSPLPHNPTVFLLKHRRCRRLRMTLR